MNCSMATDDKLAGYFVAEGHIDHCVRLAIKKGVPPMAALQIATISTARHYRLRNFGAIAPRYWADFIVFDDLKKLVVRQTIKRHPGRGGRRIPGPAAHAGSPAAQHTINLALPGQPSPTILLSAPRFVPNPGHRDGTRIKSSPGRRSKRPHFEGGYVASDVMRDILKLVVVERHHATGNVGVGFVRWIQTPVVWRLGLPQWPTDAHNVIAVGVTDADITLAIEELVKMQGGQVAVSDGKVRAALPLPIAGLVSHRPLPEVIDRIADLNAAARAMGCRLDPCL